MHIQEEIFPMEFKHNKCLIHVGLMTSKFPFFISITKENVHFFRFVNSIRQMLPLFMVLSWIFTVSMNVKDIVHEKEKYKPIEKYPK
jgi:hypothetical protein